MIRSARAFVEGIYFHRKGISLALHHTSFLLLSLIPFTVSVVLYGLAFYLFSAHAGTLLDSIWHVSPQSGSQAIGWLHWIVMHLVKYFLYFVILIMMYYTFIVFANIIGSPIYDHISVKCQRLCYASEMEGNGKGHGRSWLRVVAEEVKKGFLILLVPLILFFIPVVGAVLALVIAPVFTAWEFIDFSLAREHVLLKDRLTILWNNKFYFLGFGVPLLIPVFGIFLMPFAVLGGTMLYFEKIRKQLRKSSI